MTFEATAITAKGPEQVGASAVLEDVLKAARMAMLQGAVSVTIRDTRQTVSSIGTGYRSTDRIAPTEAGRAWGSV